MAKLRLAPLDPRHPENAGVLAHLARGGGAAELVARPSSVPDPLWGCGSHPDIVEHLWDGLGRNLPRACRALVLGSPALLHARAGLVLAAALGTQYALRVPPARHAAAERAGLARRHVYRTSGDVLELAGFGSGWFLGAWSPEEPAWLLEEHARLDGPAGQLRA
ncbi:MAG TPA: hypothetical protein VF530_06515 [Planctomycetota bacterium]